MAQTMVGLAGILTMGCLFLVACQSPAGPLARAPHGDLVSTAAGPLSPLRAGPDIQVRVTLAAGPFGTKALQRRVGDVSRLHYDLVATATPTVVLASFDTPSTTCRFNRVPDGTYRVRVEAFDAGNVSITQTNPAQDTPVLGPIASTNTVTVTSPAVTYSNAGVALSVPLTLLNATGETVSGVGTTFVAGLPWTGAATARSTSPDERFARTYRVGRATNYPSGRLAVAPNATGFFLIAPDQHLITLMDPWQNRENTIIGQDSNPGFNGKPLAIDNMLNGPVAAGTDLAGNVYVAERDNAIVSRIQVDGSLRIVAGQPQVPGFDGDGGPASAAKITVTDMAVDTGGRIYVCDADNSVIRMVDPVTGVISLLAGDAGGRPGNPVDNTPASSNSFTRPYALALDEQRNLYVADGDGRISRIDLTVTPPVLHEHVTFAELTQAWCLVVGPNRQVYAMTNDRADAGRIVRLDAVNRKLIGVAGGGSGGLTDGRDAQQVKLGGVARGLTFDRYGTLYFTDPDTRSLWRLGW